MAEELISHDLNLRVGHDVVVPPCVFLLSERGFEYGESQYLASLC